MVMVIALLSSILLIMLLSSEAGRALVVMLFKGACVMAAIGTCGFALVVILASMKH